MPPSWKCLFHLILTLFIKNIPTLIYQPILKYKHLLNIQGTIQIVLFNL